METLASKGSSLGCVLQSRDGAGLVYPYQLDIFGEIWTLIAGGVMAILGLALDYYSILRALCDGVAAPNATGRCSCIRSENSV